MLVASGWRPINAASQSGRRLSNQGFDDSQIHCPKNTKLKPIKTVDVDEGQFDTVIKNGRTWLGFSLAAKTLYEKIPSLEKPRDKLAARLACKARLQQRKVFEAQPLLIREGLAEQ